MRDLIYALDSALQNFDDTIKKSTNRKETSSLFWMRDLKCEWSRMSEV